MRRTIDDFIVDGQTVVARSRSEATHVGEFCGRSAIRTQVTVTAVVIYRIAGGRIRETWADIDFPRLMRQLPPPAISRRSMRPRVARSIERGLHRCASLFHHAADKRSSIVGQEVRRPHNR